MKALVLDRNVIKANLQTIRKRVRVPLIADLSCDGQGVGVVELATLLRDEGVHSFAVSEVWDAERLRRAQFTDERIYMLRTSADREELDRLLDLDVVCSVGSLEAALALSAVAGARSAVAEAQVEIDVGFGGGGFLPSEAEKIENVYRNIPNLAVVGMYGKMSAPWKNKAHAQAQIDVFSALVEKLRGAGVDVGLVHLLDSPGAMRFSPGQTDAVRAGAGLIGRLPGRFTGGLQPAGYVEAELDEVAWVAKGRHIGPGGEYQMRRSGRVGRISAGWGNGLGLARPDGQWGQRSLITRLRGLFRGGPAAPVVRLDGKRLRVLGRVGVGSMLVDVSGVDCAGGSRVTIEADPRMVKGLPRLYR